AAGAQDVLVIDRYAHLVGGCRMGADPEKSVVDADHRTWEVPNLFIADGSVMPTQGSANPALTIMALASRLAERMDLKRFDAQLQRPRRRWCAAQCTAGAAASGWKIGGTGWGWRGILLRQWSNCGVFSPGRCTIERCTSLPRLRSSQRSDS